MKHVLRVLAVAAVLSLADGSSLLAQGGRAGQRPGRAAGDEQGVTPDEIQRMSAGSGIVHSEFNASRTEPVHLLQIWLQPATTGTPTSYEQIRFEPEEKKGKLKLLAGPSRRPRTRRCSRRRTTRSIKCSTSASRPNSAYSKSSWNDVSSSSSCAPARGIARPNHRSYNDPGGGRSWFLGT